MYNLKDFFYYNSKLSCPIVSNDEKALINGHQMVASGKNLLSSSFS
jgi:hypothetical protein